MPINEPTFKTTKPLGDEVVFSLGFDWRNGQWVKISKNNILWFLVVTSVHSTMSYLLISCPAFLCHYRLHVDIQIRLLQHMIQTYLLLSYLLWTHMLSNRLPFSNCLTRFRHSLCCRLVLSSIFLKSINISFCSNNRYLIDCDTYLRPVGFPLPFHHLHHLSGLFYVLPLYFAMTNQHFYFIIIFLFMDI